MTRPRLKALNSSNRAKVPIGDPDFILTHLFGTSLKALAAVKEITPSALAYYFPSPSIPGHTRSTVSVPRLHQTALIKIR